MAIITKRSSKQGWIRYSVIKILIVIGVVIILIFIILISRLHVIDLNNPLLSASKRTYGHHHTNVITTTINSITTINTINDINTIRIGKSDRYLYTQRKQRKIYNSLDIGHHLYDKDTNSIDTNSIGGLYKVYNSNGVVVRSSISLDSPIVTFLPVETYILVNRIYAINDTNTKHRLHIYYPVDGYITLINDIGLYNARPFFIEIDNNINDSNDCIIDKYLHGIDIRGGDIQGGQVSSSSSEQCCIQCRNNGHCHSWTFTPDGSCWLKHTKINDNNANMIAVKPFISGFKTATTSMMMSRINDASYCCTNDDHDYKSSYRLKIDQKSYDWTSQFPIGTGLFGALVGGSYRHEIIPISISNFFVKRINIDSNKNKTNKVDAFKEARVLLSQGQTLAAKKKLQVLKTEGLGMFQYISDLTLLLSSEPLVVKVPVSTLTQPPLPPFNTKNVGHLSKIQRNVHHKPPLVQQGRVQQGRVQQGRVGVLNRLKSDFINFNNNDSNNNNNNDNSDDNEHVYEGILDMKDGIAHSNYIIEDKYVRNYTTVYKINANHFEDGHDDVILMNENAMILHHREWFASNIDSVIVGSISCNRGGDEVYYYYHNNNNYYYY